MKPIRSVIHGCLDPEILDQYVERVSKIAYYRDLGDTSYEPQVKRFEEEADILRKLILNRMKPTL